MKNGFTKKITILMAVFLLVLSMAACGSDPSADGSDVQTIAITMNILYPDTAQKENVENYNMQVQKDATVMQILESYSNQENTAIEVDSSGTAYVTSINGVKAEGSSGWVYEVNDEKNITKGAADYKAKDGDKIVWKYVTY